MEHVSLSKLNCTIKQLVRIPYNHNTLSKTLVYNQVSQITNNGGGGGVCNFKEVVIVIGHSHIIIVYIIEHLNMINYNCLANKRGTFA